jgi:hypothetical protein
MDAHLSRESVINKGLNQIFDYRNIYFNATLPIRDAGSIAMHAVDFDREIRPGKIGRSMQAACFRALKRGSDGHPDLENHGLGTHG